MLLENSPLLSATGEPDRTEFTITPLDTPCPVLDQHHRSFFKWGLKDMKVRAFRYDEPLTKAAEIPYLQAGLLKTFVHHMMKGTPQVLQTTTGSLSIFDGLKEKEGILHPNGDVQECLDISFDPDRMKEADLKGVSVTDKVREALIFKDSPHYTVFSPAVRKEFLFHLFQSFLFGGPLNQREPKLEPVLEVTRKMYKTLMDVYQWPDGSLEAVSVVWKTLGDSMPHGNQFAFTVVNPLARTGWVLIFGAPPLM